MSKIYKTLGSADSPYIISLMRLIESQSKATIASWAMDYVQNHILPIYMQYYPSDRRPQMAIDNARLWLKGEIKLPMVKDSIINGCHCAAREAIDIPAAQAAARAVGQAAAIVHTPNHSIWVAFYGAAAVAYNRVGLNESAQTYDLIAAEVCADMELALMAIAVQNELCRAKINWKSSNKQFNHGDMIAQYNGE